MTTKEIVDALQGMGFGYFGQPGYGITVFGSPEGEYRVGGSEHLRYPALHRDPPQHARQDWLRLDPSRGDPDRHRPEWVLQVAWGPGGVGGRFDGEADEQREAAPGQSRSKDRVGGDREEPGALGLLDFERSPKPWIARVDVPSIEVSGVLDLPSIGRLEDALEAYPGALLLVTHDSSLASACTTDRWEVEQGGGLRTIKM